MNRDELIAKAKEAYAKTEGGMSLSPDESCQKWILEFAAMITEPIEAEIAELKAHDDELIERCAKICDSRADDPVYCGEAIRALKG